MVCILRTRKICFSFKYILKAYVSLNTFVFHGCRKLYWSDRGTNSGIPPKIASANMDGKSLRTLFTGSLENVAFITLDIEEQKLYWAVSNTGVVRAHILVSWSLLQNLCS